MVTDKIFVAVRRHRHDTARPSGKPGNSWGEVAEWLKATAGNGRYTAQAVSEVRILPLSAKISGADCRGSTLQILA